MPRSHTRRLAYINAARLAGRRWRTYLALFGFAVATVTVVALAPNFPLRQGYAGGILGAIAALTVISLVSMTNPVHPRLADKWNLAQLRKVRGWHVTDHLPFDRDDVDHVVVAPSAVLAVESKYHARPIAGPDVEGDRLRRDLVDAESAANKVRLLLRAEQLRDAAVVVPVLIEWGPGAPALPDGHRLENGVHIVDGHHPERWMHLFNDQRLSTGARRELHARFERFVSRRAKDDAHLLPSLRHEMWRELRGGIAYERTQRAARHRTAAQVRATTNLDPVPAPGTPVVPTAVPVVARATQAGRLAS